MATIQDRERAKDIARKALAHGAVEQLRWSKAISISEIAYALAKIGDEALANEAFSMARNAAWTSIPRRPRLRVVCRRRGDGSGWHEKGRSPVQGSTEQLYTWSPPEEIEDEYRAIYVDYRARSGRNLESLFPIALEIKDRNQRQAALHSLAARLAKAVLDGDYPHGSRGERNVDRLCDREMFLSIGGRGRDDFCER